MISADYGSLTRCVLALPAVEIDLLQQALLVVFESSDHVCCVWESCRL